MTDHSFTTSIMVGQSPEEVYNAISNVRGWWSQNIEGKTDELHAVFFYHHRDVHLCKIEIVELIPGEKIVWLVKENYFNFVEDNTEWKGTKIIFEISKIADKTRLVFTHHGLIPQHECYEVCKDAWTSYIQGSLKSLITTGKGKPNPKEGGLNAELVEKWGLPKSSFSLFSWTVTVVSCIQ